MSGIHRAQGRRRLVAWSAAWGYLLAVLLGAVIGLALPASPDSPAPIAVASSSARAAASPPTAARAQVRTVYYLVRPGDTLTAIAARFHRPSYRVIWGINRFEVPDPNLIHPGQLLIIGVTSR